MSRQLDKRESKKKKKKNIYIYIYIVIHRQICFVLSELISVARQYLPVAGIETRLTETHYPTASQPMVETILFSYFLSTISM